MTTISGAGKHKFTPADLEEAVAAAKSIALTTMLSSIFPAAEYAHTFLRTVYPKFPNVMKQILGFQEFYWWIELASGKFDVNILEN